MRPYKFSVELDALRQIIQQEHSLAVKYKDPTYANIKPVQILLDSFLSETVKDRDRKRELRLAILSLWVEHEVTTAYDLTIYQCSVIADFFDFHPAETLGKRAEKFLADCKAKVEDGVVPGESEYYSLQNEDATPVRLDCLS